MNPHANDRPTSDPRDISFTVPMTHRVRFTNEVAGADFHELLAVLHRSSASDERSSREGPSTGNDSAVKVLIWADEDVARASDRVSQIESKLKAATGIDLVAPTGCFHGGETIKNDSAVVDRMLRQINLCNLDRRSYVIAIGGGAVLDVAGYASSIAHRGIRLIRLPTTTLAQGDSGVGVKNAINQFNKKNWVGTFAVPWAVINDTGFLRTLPDRDFCCGFSEAVKVSLLKSRDMFDSLCRNASRIAARDMEAATEVIKQSCQMHLRHITEGGDPFESLESRPLDFGHWSAHRLEPLTNYEIRHGEAVAIGVALDTWYSAIRYGFPVQAAALVCRCLADLRLPLWHRALEDFDRVLAGLEEFRQHLGGRLTVTMLQDVANPIDVHEIDYDSMRLAARKLRDFLDERR